MGAGRRKFLGFKVNLANRNWEEVAPELQGFVRMTVDAMAQTADWIISGNEESDGFSFLRPLTAPVCIGGEQPIVGALGEGTVQIEGFDAKPSLLLHETFDSSETRAGIEILKRRDTVWTALQSGDEIGGITWSGADGAKAVTAASIHVDVFAAASNEEVPGNIIFSTRADGGSSLVRRFEINELGIHVFKTSVTDQGGQLKFEAPGGSYTDTLRIDSYQNSLRFINDSTVLALFDANGNFVSGLNNTFDIGTSSNQWKQIFGGDIFLSSLARFTERADPGASAANTGYLYMKDNGAGKTQLIVQFSSGGEIVLATQP